MIDAVEAQRPLQSQEVAELKKGEQAAQFMKQNALKFLGTLEKAKNVVSAFEA